MYEQGCVVSTAESQGYLVDGNRNRVMWHFVVCIVGKLAQDVEMV